MNRCLIIDDEPLARKLVAAHVSKIEGLTIAGECGSAVEAIGFLQKKKVDLIFLDIQMPEITGLQFIKTLKTPPAIILVTAHREFAFEAFDLNALDYLQKPISFERLLKAVNKFFEIKPSAETPALQETDDFIFLKSERKTIRILLNDIFYIESLDDYVKIHLEDRFIVTRENISSLQQLLPESKFVRVHRSFIVATFKVDSITAEYLEIGKKQIPFGRAFKQAALALLGISNRW